MILACRVSCGTILAAFRLSRSTTPPSTAASSDKRTSALKRAVRERKPIFGRRRCSGIWPPSKPTVWKPPARACWPLWPRAEVLPRPEPTPRPTRFGDCLLPSAGLMVFRRMSGFLDFEHVRDLVDHAPVLRGVEHGHGMVQTPQPKPRDAGTVALQPTGQAAPQRHFELLLACRLLGCHDY